MDTILQSLNNFIIHVTSSPTTNLVLVIIGSLLPSIIGIVLPRRQTITYGMFINKFIGTIFLQKRRFQAPAAENLWEALGHAIQTTFQDLSFGVYLDGREDLSSDDKKAKIEDYLITVPAAPAPAVPAPVAPAQPAEPVKPAKP